MTAFTQKEFDLLISAAHMYKFRRYEGIMAGAERIRNFENDMDDLIHKLYENEKVLTGRIV